MADKEQQIKHLARQMLAKNDECQDELNVLLELHRQIVVQIVSDCDDLITQTKRECPSGCWHIVLSFLLGLFLGSAGIVVIYANYL